MEKKILIIGGAGFIGINAAELFIRKGHQVTILDNLSRKGTDLNLAWLESAHPGKYVFVRADVVSDFDILAREIATHDAVLHLAAQVAVTTSVTDPRHDFNVNLGGTLNVIEAIRTSQGKKPSLIYASTNKVYGDLSDISVVEEETRYSIPQMPEGVSEERQLDFHSPYGCSKGGADQYVRDYARIYGLKTAVVRQSCIYGRRQFGIEDQGWIAWFIIAALLGKPITLYGNGKQVRDVLFVDDLVELYEAMFDKMDSIRGQIFNVGGGPSNSVSILELFSLLETNHKLSVSYSKSDIRPGDQKIFISNNKKIHEAVGWMPKISLEEGVAGILAWTKENLKLIESLY